MPARLQEKLVLLAVGAATKHLDLLSRTQLTCSVVAQHCSNTGVKTCSCASLLVCFFMPTLPYIIARHVFSFDKCCRRHCHLSVDIFVTDTLLELIARILTGTSRTGSYRRILFDLHRSTHVRLAFISQLCGISAVHVCHHHCNYRCLLAYMYLKHNCFE